MTKTNANVKATAHQTSSRGEKELPTSSSNPRRGATSKVVTTAAASPSVTAKVTKRDQLAALVARDEGATLEQMIAVTGWLPHTTRAALTGLRKSGYVIDSDRVHGVRTYRAVAPQ